MTILQLLLGIVLLVLGAELLVRGASRLALALGIQPLVVGLTVVAFGTSAPEMAVSTSAAFSGQADIAMGNVVGSNTFNVLLILGLSALVAPLRVSARLVRFDVPVMIGVSLLVLVMAVDGQVSRVDGLLLLAGMLGYLGLQFRGGSGTEPAAGEGAGEGAAEPGPEEPGPRRRPLALAADVVLVVAGLVLLVLGSRWLVGSAEVIATRLGVSELMIGLTIVAAGTSLPELATSVLAAIRGQRDIAVGNVVGSNIFNILAILGLAAAVAPDGLAVTPAAVTFDIPIMTAVALACLPVFFTGGVVARWEGALFVGYYLAYTAYLALHAADHGVLPAFRDGMLYFVIPLTVITLLVTGWRARPGRQSPLRSE